MANYNDLRTILGNQYDFGTNDFITASGLADTINIYGGDDWVNALGGDDLIFDVRSLNGGNSGNDTVSAGDGNDLIVSSLDSTNFYSGGLGTDTLNVIPNGNGVAVDLAAGTAKDRSTLATSQLVSIENVVGSAWSDYLYGDAGSNSLSGYNGDDLLRGQAGIDNLDGGRGRDVLFGGTERDIVSGGDDDDMVYGEAGNDSLSGGLGNDYIIGGLGKDYMTGGLGTDTFRFAALNESGVTGSSADMISDFQHLADKIDVRDIDANSVISGNQAFRFVGTSAFSAAGQVRYIFDAGSQDTIVLFNTDNDPAAEMIIKIDPQVGLSRADFLL